MKKLLYLILLFVINWTITAQDQFTGIVQYDFIINNPNGVSFANPYLLYFNNQVSFYIENGDAKRIDSSIDHDMMEITGNIVEEKIMKSTLSKDYVYTNVDKCKLIFQEEINQKVFVVNDSIANIKWKLSTKNKKIGKYTCQKADGLYRGRTYTVWFTTEIPVSHGPWKLRGLPGLIVEATDQTNKFKYEIAKIDLGVNPLMVEKKIVIPDDVKKIRPMSVYVDAIKNEYENTMARARASLPKGARLAEDHECDECPKRNNRTKELYN